MENNTFNFINIITPCSRPKNLLKISESINIPRENYRWIVVYDGDSIPPKELIPENCEIYSHKNKISTVGHSQRNYAINLVKGGYVYFNDDDTIIHKDLWENIKSLDNDFISFKQAYKDGSIRFISNKISVGYIDSHNFITHSSIIGETRFNVTKYDADGHFAVECFAKSKNHIHLDMVLSTYNLLR